MLATRHLEIEALILVLLTVLRAGITIMELNGKSRFKRPSRSYQRQAFRQTSVEEVRDVQVYRLIVLKGTNHENNRLSARRSACARFV